MSVRSGSRLQTIDKVWQRMRREAGLTGVRLHDLRHSHASLLVNSGCCLGDMQYIADPALNPEQDSIWLAGIRLQDVL